jgi:excisionase family DNA binding protein
MTNQPETPEELPVLPGYITISKAAELMRVTRQTAHQMTRDGRLRAWRVPSAGTADPVVVEESQARTLARQTQQVVTLL